LGASPGEGLFHNSHALLDLLIACDKGHKEPYDVAKRTSGYDDQSLLMASRQNRFVSSGAGSLVDRSFTSSIARIAPRPRISRRSGTALASPW